MHCLATLALVVAPVSALAQDLPSSVQPGKVPFTQSVLVEGLNAPWEITYGPDGMLWVTERAAGDVLRIDPATGAITVAGRIDEVSAPGWQNGLLGLALDPGLLQGTGNDFVYVAHTYDDRDRPADPTVADPASPYAHFYARIVRLRFDPATGLLSDPVTLIDGMPAGSDHNSGRLKIGPEGMLYYTIGDQGNDQLANWCIPIEAQRLPTAEEMAAGDYFAYQGKSLRLNLDGSVPADNPVLNGVQSHVFTYGHRNMQGIAFGPDGTLYASEQGPKTDDEVNILVAGGNYGWPHVAGFRDDMAYQYAEWSEATVPCETLTFSDIVIDPSVPRTDETAWTEPMQDPLATLFTVPSDWNFEDPACGGVNYICWPTVAASSIEAYRPEGGGIDGFDNALLITTLKGGSLFRVPLTADGLAAAGPMERYFRTENRYRDTAVRPDGRTIFIATDIDGQFQAPDGGVGDGVTHQGAILVFTYSGD
jgi:PQQ-dependent dehydrogenase (s-GDH family)